MLRLRTTAVSVAALLVALPLVFAACGEGGGGPDGSGGAGTGGSPGTGAAPASGGSGGGANTGGVASGGGGNTGGTTTGGAGNTGGAATGGGANTGGAGAGGSGTGGQATVEHRECGGTPFPAVTLTQLTTEGAANVHVTSPPNDASRLFVTDLMGTLRIIKDDGNVVTAGTIPVGTTFGEQGFFSVAFHPNFDGATEKRIYLSYIDTSENSRVVETTIDGDTLDTTDLEGKTIVHQPQPNRNHNGGLVTFGPDGYLYVGFGDGGNQCDIGHDDTGFFPVPGNAMPDHQAIDLTSALGSILRIDVDNLETFPAGNISTENGQDGRIFHWGLRNPWRFSFDRGTGDLWIGDVGQNAWEELNVLPAASPGVPGPSTNFGWPGLEGTHDSSASDCDTAPAPDTSAMLPVHEYPAIDGRSITGGFVYRGSAIPEMQGRYIFADYQSNAIWTITWDGEKACDHADISEVFDEDGVLRGITSFGEDANGELYVTTVLQGAGVYRVDPK